MRLEETVMEMAELGFRLEDDVIRLGALPDDSKPRLQQIRRLCNRLLLGEFETGGGDDGARGEGE